ncbi:UNVERIFIED_CONTAM: hypothetical protein HHA_256792 [Hammondia hammondi]|eukprot:XP_008883289.1 hypothetical protein HHA_256792 [Hammondia hammondi]
MVKSAALLVLFHMAVTVPVNTLAGEGSGVIPSDPCDPSADSSSARSCNTPVRDTSKPWRISPGEASSEEHQKDADGSREKHAHHKETRHTSSTKSHAGDLPYAYDASAKPLGGQRPDGAGPYPLYYTSYHLFAPSPAEAKNPGMEYFGEPPDSTDPAYYGLYQDLASDVFSRQSAQSRTADDTRADTHVKPGGRHRRLRHLQELEEDDDLYFM